MKEEFSIPVTGLKDGEHHYEFALEDTFFEHFENPEVSRGSVTLEVVLTKRATMMILDLTFRGTVHLLCDRCSVFFDQPVEHEDRLIVKVTEENEFGGEEDVLVLDPEDPAIDLAQEAYEMVMISIPQRRVHPEGQCDPDSIEKLESLKREKNDGLKGRTEEGIDPRWEALKKLR